MQTSVQSMLARAKQSMLVALVLGSASLTAHAVAISGQGTWETTLQARDVNNDGTTDAYYDTALNITWLADANYVGSSGHMSTASHTGASPGQLYWQEAVSWVSSLDVHGVTDWRLASTDYSSAPSFVCSFTVCSYTPDAAGDELSHLNQVTLGNAADGSFNTAGFTNLSQSTAYGYANLYMGKTGVFSFNGGGFSEISAEQMPLSAWAVHDGDIAAPVPEPQTYALMGLGLALIAASSVKKKRITLRS